MAAVCSPACKARPQAPSQRARGVTLAQYGCRKKIRLPRELIGCNVTLPIGS